MSGITSAIAGGDTFQPPVGATAQRSDVKTAPPSGAALAAEKDSIRLSDQAKQMLAAYEVLTAAARSDNRPAGLRGTVQAPVSSSIAIIAAVGARGLSVTASTAPGFPTSIEATIDGPDSANTELDVAAFAADDDIHLATRISTGNGNDTVNAVTNGELTVKLGSGDDTANVVTTGHSPDTLSAAFITLGSGNDVVNLDGSGAVGGSTGTGTINLVHGSGDMFAIGFGGSGTTTINGTGSGIMAWGGTGTTIINNVGDIVMGKLDTGTTTANMPNAATSQVSLGPGWSGNLTLNLSSVPVDADQETAAASSEKMFSSVKGNAVLNGGKGDANGNFSGQGFVSGYEDVLPIEGQAGYGLPHTKLQFNVDADSIASVLNGSTLTMTEADTGATVTINNYQAGQLTFVFGSDDDGDYVTASRQPPNLTVSDGPSS